MRVSLYLSLMTLFGFFAGCSSNTETETTVLDPVVLEADTSPVGSEEEAVSDKEEESAVALTPDVLALFEVIPQKGVIEGGDSITLYGNGFVRESRVFFGEQETGPPIFLEHSLLSVISPAADVGVVDVRVENPDGTTVVLENSFRYYAPFGIESVYPIDGPLKGGTALTVEGFGFPDNVKILIGGKEAIKAEKASENSLIAITPEGDSIGAVDIHVWTEAGATVLEDAFVYREALQVDAVIPPYGSTSGNEYITIIGSGLDENTRVFIDDTECSVDNAGEVMSVLTPAHDVGPALIRVENSDGSESDELPFYYVDESLQEMPFSLLSVLPNTGPTSGKFTVTLIASGLSDATGSTVTFGQSDADVTAFQDAIGVIEVLLPEGEAGSVDVTLTSDGESSTISNGFTYESALTLSNVIPNEGLAEGGILVRLEGVGLENVTQVEFGPLPATDLQLEDDGSLTLRIPPGSPGATTIWLNRAGESTPFENVFTYTSEGLTLWAVSPGEGPQGGNTTASLYGSNFPEQGTVRFGKNLATHYTWLSSTEVEVRVPSANQPGVVDVSIESLADEYSLLLGGYTYINPESGWGGTWGGKVDGTLNVTVKDVWLDSGIEEAFVVLWTGEETEYQGYTNWLGQISFSGEDIEGVQMITAWKEGYSASSIVEFDSENATVLLFPEQPTSNSSGGGGGAESPFSQLGTIEGKVLFNSKYLVPPPGNCPDQPLDPESILCSPCETNEQCGNEGDLCTAMPNGGSHCTTACETGAECPSGYACMAVSLEDTKQCLPITGMIQIRCETSRSNSSNTNPQPGEGSVADPVTGEFSIQARTGDLAVICTGELFNPATGDTTPLAMGAAWPISVIKGETTSGVEIELDVPLTRSVTMSMGYPPSRLLALPNHQFRALLQFGSLEEYGVHEIRRLSLTPGVDSVFLNHLPEGLFASLDGSSWLLLGGAYSEASTFVQWFPPYSTAVRRNLPGLANDHLYREKSGAWLPAGIPTTPLDAVWGHDANHTYAVGEDNNIYFFNGSAWSLLKSPTQADWVGVWGPNASSTYIIGSTGEFVYADESGWVSGGEIPLSPTAIGGVDADTIVVTGLEGKFAQWDGASWILQETGQEADLHDVWAAVETGQFWFVGAEGTILRMEDGEIFAEESGSAADLQGVFGTPNGKTIYACGSLGTLLKRNAAGEWSTIATNMTQTLYDLWVDSEGQVTAVGQMGSILRYIPSAEEGNQIAVQSLEDSGAILKSVWGIGDSVEWVVGRDALFFGPLLEVAEFTSPGAPGGVIGDKVSWAPVGGAFPDFTFVEVGSPWWKPIWQMVVAGGGFSVDLPDLKELTGNAPTGQGVLLQISRVRQNGFSMESFNYFDVYFSEFTWDAWSVNTTTVTLY